MTRQARSMEEISTTIRIDRIVLSHVTGIVEAVLVLPALEALRESFPRATDWGDHLEVGETCLCEKQSLAAGLDGWQLERGRAARPATSLGNRPHGQGTSTRADRSACRAGPGWPDSLAGSVPSPARLEADLLGVTPRKGNVLGEVDASPVGADRT